MIRISPRAARGIGLAMGCLGMAGCCFPTLQGVRPISVGAMSCSTQQVGQASRVTRLVGVGVAWSSNRLAIGWIDWRIVEIAIHERPGRIDLPAGQTILFHPPTPPETP